MTVRSVWLCSMSLALSLKALCQDVLHDNKNQHPAEISSSWRYSLQSGFRIFSSKRVGFTKAKTHDFIDFSCSSWKENATKINLQQMHSIAIKTSIRFLKPYFNYCPYIQDGPSGNSNPIGKTLIMKLCSTISLLKLMHRNLKKKTDFKPF